MRCSGGSAVQVPNMHPPIHKNALEAYTEVFVFPYATNIRHGNLTKTVIFWRFQQLLVFDGVRRKGETMWANSWDHDSHCLEMVDVSLLLNEVLHQANMSVSILRNHNASCNENKPLVWWKSSSVIIFQPTKWQRFRVRQLIPMLMSKDTFLSASVMFIFNLDLAITATFWLRMKRLVPFALAWFASFSQPIF